MIIKKVWEKRATNIELQVLKYLSDYMYLEVDVCDVSRSRLYSLEIPIDANVLKTVTMVNDVSVSKDVAELYIKPYYNNNSRFLVQIIYGDGTAISLTPINTVESKHIGRLNSILNRIDVTPRIGNMDREKSKLIHNLKDAWSLKPSFITDGRDIQLSEAIDRLFIKDSFCVTAEEVTNDTSLLNLFLNLSGYITIRRELETEYDEVKLEPLPGFNTMIDSKNDLYICNNSVDSDNAIKTMQIEHFFINKDKYVSVLVNRAGTDRVYALATVADKLGEWNGLKLFKDEIRLTIMNKLGLS